MIKRKVVNINAEKILKAKNYVPTAFDTEGFKQAVLDFFSASPVQAHLRIIPWRFLDISDNFNPWGLTDSDRERGFLVQTEYVEVEDEDGKKGKKLKYVADLEEKFPYQLKAESKIGIAYAPRLIIDRPFINNAKFVLETNKYVVEEVKFKSFCGKRFWGYDVTLI